MKNTLSTLLAGALISGAVFFTAGSPAAQAQTYEVDPVHSYIVFEVLHAGVGKTYGRFNEFIGSISFDEADPAKSSVKFEIMTESIDTANEDRDNHLRGEDFFNVKVHPKATFESTEVSAKGDGVYEVKGNLTLLGETKPITVTYTDIGTGKNPAGADIRGGEATFAFKRSDFGMTAFLENNGIGDEVEMIVAVEGIKQ